MITFYGGDTQTGVTMIAQSVGERLAGKGFRVLFIGAGTEPGDDYIPGKTAASLEDLRPYLAEGTLTAREAEQSIVSCRKLDILQMCIRDSILTVRWRRQPQRYLKRTRRFLMRKRRIIF